MVADREKRDAAIKNLEHLSAARMCYKKRFWPAKMIWNLICSLRPSQDLTPGNKSLPSEEEFNTVGFHYIGIERACKMLVDAGFRIVDPDMGTVHRDAMVHFIKP